MQLMFVTLEVSKLLKSSDSRQSPKNIQLISVTFEVLKLLRLSSLNEFSESNENM